MSKQNEIWELAADVVNSFWRGDLNKDDGNSFSDKVIMLSNLIGEHKPDLLESIKEYDVPVVWENQTTITVRAASLKEAKELARELFQDGIEETDYFRGSKYVEGSLKTGK